MADQENSSQSQADEPPSVLSCSSPAQSPALVRIRQFPSEMEANLAAIKLEAEGLHPQLAGQALQAGLGAYGAVSAGVDLFISREEIDAASRILDAVEAVRAKNQAAHDARLRCPRCGAEDGFAGDRSRIRIGIALIFVGITTGVVLMVTSVMLISLPGCIDALVLLAGVGIYFLITGQSRRTCRQCGHIWVPPEDDLDDE
jgi:hypothetical protein